MTLKDKINIENKAAELIMFIRTKSECLNNPTTELILSDSLRKNLYCLYDMVYKVAPHKTDFVNLCTIASAKNKLEQDVIATAFEDWQCEDDEPLTLLQKAEAVLKRFADDPKNENDRELFAVWAELNDNI